MRMPRPKPEDISNAGQDSFLDVVTNIVGILIILVMVIGGRVHDADPGALATGRYEHKAAIGGHLLSALGPQLGTVIEADVALQAGQAALAPGGWVATPIKHGVKAEVVAFVGRDLHNLAQTAAVLASPT